MRDSERDTLVQTLLSSRPSQLAGQFKVEKKYKLTQRLVFIASGPGGEVCWEFREKLVDTISAQELKINDKELKVRVEEHPEKRDKRRSYWKAVEALRAVRKEDTDFIIEPATFGIHDNNTLARLGMMEDGEFKWNTDALSSAFPGIDVTVLRRATIFGRRE